MTVPVHREWLEPVQCPICEEPLRREFDGVRNPPAPGVFWFCTNADCTDGARHKIFSGG